MRGREEQNTAISGPLSARLRNGVSLPCHWWPNIECVLGSFVIFQGILTSIAKKPYILVNFQGGGPDLCLPPLDPCVPESDR